MAGFVEIDDHVLLTGTVVRVWDPMPRDGDWCFQVRPDYAALLVNHNGRRNRNGFIDCEVKPSPSVYGPLGARTPNDQKNDVMRQYMPQLRNRRVWVVGTFVADGAHSVDDQDCDFNWNRPWPWANCNDAGKTEIHPVTSIVIFPQGFGTQPVNRVALFVFSDAGRTFHEALHAKEERTGVFRLPIGPVSTATGNSASYDLVREVNLAASRNFSIEQEGGNFVFRGTVSSGIPSQGKGFYHAVIDLRFVGKYLGVTAPSFPRVDLGGSAARVLELRNQGSVSLSLSIAGPPGGSPFQWQPVNTSLVPGGKLTVAITFRPPRIGGFAETLQVISDAPGSPHTIVLNGRGQSPACAGLLAEIRRLDTEIQSLQNERQTASPSEKARLTTEIGALQSEVAPLREEADALGCR